MNGHIWRLLEVGEIVKDGDEAYVGYWLAVNKGEIGIHSHLHRRRVPIWPSPRDAKTDPPQPSDCDADGRILICGPGGRWFAALRAALDEIKGAVWLSLPAPPTPEAEKAWEAYCAVHGTPVSGCKDMFIHGFNAGKGSK